MDYGTLTNSAVPHVTTLGSHFKIEYHKYQYSLILQASFMILVLPLLSIWIYFSAKYKAPKKSSRTPEEQGEHDRKSNKQELSYIDAKSQLIEDDADPNKSTSSNKKPTLHEQYTLAEVGNKNFQTTKTKLEQIQRKICYGVCYFSLYVVVVNSFDCGILAIVCFYIGIMFYIVFNLIQIWKCWAVLGLYVVPGMICGIGFWIGKHELGVHVS